MITAKEFSEKYQVKINSDWDLKECTSRISNLKGVVLCHVPEFDEGCHMLHLRPKLDPVTYRGGLGVEHKFISPDNLSTISMDEFRALFE